MKKRALFTTAILTITMIAVLAAGVLAGTMSPTDVVTLVSGSNSVVLTAGDLANINAVEVQAAFLRTTGRIEGPAVYKGVPLDDLLSKVGGMSAAQAIRVTSRDGYAMTYSYSQTRGSVLTYDNEGNVSKVGGVEMFLAFESTRDGADSLPRLILAHRDNVVVTDGHYWAKQVASIEVVPGVEDWVIKLNGIEQADLDRSAFESIVTCPDTPHPGVKVTVEEKDGSTSTYVGAPLWVIVSMIDGGDAPGGHYMFNDDLAAQGYTVRLVAVDGTTVDIDSKLMARNDDVVLAYVKNGQELPMDSEGPLRLVGSALPSRRDSLKQIVEIQLVGF